MKFYVLGTRVYLPEPIAEYFANCFSLKLPKKYYEVTSASTTITITFRDDENRVSPVSYTHLTLPTILRV